MAKNGHFSQNELKIPVSRGSPAGVLHQPLAPGPRGSGGGGLGPSWGGVGPGASGRPFSDLRDPGPRAPARYRGAPARGVDVKPPSAGLPGPGSGTLRDPGTSWEGSPSPGAGIRGLPDPGPPGTRSRGSSRTGSGDLSGASRGLPGPAPRGVLHQPLAAGPRGSRGPGDQVRPHVAWSHSWPPRALRVS